MTALRDAALAYAAQGYPVVPLHSPCDCAKLVGPHCDCHRAGCASPAKHPRTAHGKDDAVANVEKIAEWWAMWPHANIGVLTGHRSGLLVVDVDPRHQGHLTLSRWKRLHGDIHAEAQSHTGGGGLHLFYRQPAATFRNGPIAQGIDLKTDGGYIVAPPSVHISGTAYSWTIPLNGHLSEPPTWLSGLIHTSPPVTTRTEGQAGPLVIPEGERDVALARMAGAMRRMGMSAEAMAAALRQQNQESCVPPLPEKDIQRIARSVARYQPQDVPRAPTVAKEDGRREAKSVAVLMSREFGPPDHVIPGLLSKGLGILGGRPKSGKSWMALDWALGVAMGGAVLGTIHVPKGEVLGLFLEDTERRLQDRIRKQLNGLPVPEGFYYETEFPRSDQGGLEALEHHLKTHPDTRLVLIDTLAKFRGARNEKAGLYEDDYAFIAALKKLADTYDCCILVLHHVRKPSAQREDNPVDMLSGTAGIAGAADSILVLRRNGPEATLFVTGRDVAESTLAVRFQGETGQWISLGDAENQAISLERRAILDVLHKADHAMTPTQIAALVDSKPNAVRRLLWSMREDNQVVSTGGGAYFAEVTVVGNADPSGNFDPSGNHGNAPTDW